ncbi:uncharacterized protein LOC114523249 [Dendronephthya gigantea]|uniref:uncharacterized protein LOC114523249 n=1 Tax=Dendronephthya gigantea TaxID=151771 RepID=UPI00106D13C6|nr:uncharacterized protein LOC114523249 [Dendronephthya gigantea]
MANDYLILSIFFSALAVQVLGQTYPPTTEEETFIFTGFGRTSVRTADRTPTYRPSIRTATGPISRTSYYRTPTRLPYRTSYYRTPTRLPYRTSYYRAPTRLPYRTSYYRTPTRLPYRTSYYRTPTRLPSRTSYYRTPTRLPYRTSYYRTPTRLPYRTSYYRTPTYRQSIRTATGPISRTSYYRTPTRLSYRTSYYRTPTFRPSIRTGTGHISRTSYYRTPTSFRPTFKPFRPSGLSETAWKNFKDGRLDKLSEEERKKLKPRYVVYISKGALEYAGEELVRNLTKLVGRGGKDDVEKLANKLNCSQLAYVLDEATKWDCSLLKGLESPVKRCRKEKGKMAHKYNLEALSRCVSFKDLDKHEFKELGDKGAFKDASNEQKKKYAKQAKKVNGDPEYWTKDDLKVMEDLLPFLPLKDLKKVQKHVLKEFLKDGGGKTLSKQRKSDIFRELFKGEKSLTAENITWICEAGFESELRSKDIKSLSDKSLEMYAKCFGSHEAHASVRREFTKRVCSNPLNFDNYTAEICVHSLADMKPSVLTNETIVELLLQQYLKLPKKPEVKGEICRKLARAFTRKFGRNSTMRAGPLVKCMDRSPEEIADDMESLKEIANSKGNKALKRRLFDVIKMNRTKYGGVLLEFNLLID